MKGAEAKRMRLTSSLIGLCFLLRLFFVEILYILMERKGLLDYNKTFAEILINLTSSILPYALLVFALQSNLTDVAALKKPVGSYLPYIGVGLGLKLFAAFLSSYVMRFLAAKSLKSGMPEALFEFEPTISGKILYLFSCAVVPALAEEFVCRGVILGVLRPFGARFAVVVSALLFGLMHGNVEQFVTTLVMGLFMGFVTVKTESIWPAIILHFFNNFFVWLFVVFPSWNNPMVALIYNSLMMAISIVSFMYMFTKNSEKFFSIKETSSINMTLFKRLLNFALAPGMVLFWGYTALVFRASFRR